MALGLFFVLLSGLAAYFGLSLLSDLAKEVVHSPSNFTKSSQEITEENVKSSYFAVSSMVFPKAAVWIDVAIAIKCFGVSISYLVICGDLVMILI